MAGIEWGRAVALANKEAWVSAGEVMTDAVNRTGARRQPVDSEHNTIFPCLAANDPAHVHAITLTASGGPFREWDMERIHRATPAEAVKHPTWSMGAKISVDSATMMNKGLEVIEAHYLFPVGWEPLAHFINPHAIGHCIGDRL